VPPHEYSFLRYLTAKKSVDDRALNAHVWQTLARALPEGELHVLEVGAGIGTMAERVAERRLFGRAHYTALDEQAGYMAEFKRRVPARLERDGLALDVEARVADALEFVARPERRGAYDVLMAHAFLDLLDLPSALPRLLGALKPGGLFYFTINFDGATIFLPELDPALDAHIEALYHRTMDERVTKGRRSGDSRAGRHLFSHLRAAGAEILAAGSSDWVVCANEQGYPADEAYFLHFILHTLHEALHGHPELEAQRFEAWIAERHAQVERGELVYIAHQLDFAGKTKDRFA
jgi:SAM-dependent methyltransferase